MVRNKNRRKSGRKHVGLKYGFRSGLEESVGQQLKDLKVNYTYESSVIEYTIPARSAKYTPDFFLPNGIIVETKGRFTAIDRKKHLMVKEQNPELDIRFVFSNPNTKLRKGSKTTYGMWCDKHGYQYAKGEIPTEWFDEQ